MKPKEFELLKILCRSDQPLSLPEILERHPDLNKNTTAVTLNNLLNQGWIEVAGHGMSNKTICREYIPTAEARNRVINQFADRFSNRSDIFSTADFCMALLKKGSGKNSKTEINRLKNMLDEFIQDNNINITKEESNHDKSILPTTDGGADQ